jgi:hypothetical protein
MQYTQLSETLILSGALCLMGLLSKRKLISWTLGSICLLAGILYREKCIYILYPFLITQIVFYWRTKEDFRSILKFGGG